jgi:flagella basal body P-ring formation protein FlgA
VLAAVLAVGRAFVRASLVTAAGAILAPAVAQPPRTAAAAGEVVATPAPRAARALARGHTLAAADVDGPPAEAARLAGWTTRRVIAAGEVLRAPAVAAPAAVRAGQSVAVVYAADGVALRLHGTAAADAPVGGRVAVRIDMRRRMEGVVEAPGVVRLP